MIPGASGRLRYNLKPKLPKIEVRNKGIDRANRVGPVDVVVEALGQERDLPTIRLRDEPLHAEPPADSLAES